jgi:uncharacterized membrane protein YkoI
MKIKRFIAFAVLALLVVGTMGAVTYHAYAHGNTAQAAQTDACAQDQADGTEVTSGPDTDNVELQCGDQNEVGDEEVGETPDNDVVEEQVGDQNTVDTGEEAESQDGQESAPSGTPAITADEAQAAAIAYHPGTVVKTELDDENGQLVYSVEFEGGADVKVDAMTGSVLGLENSTDGE